MERPEDFKLKLIFLPLGGGREVKNGYWRLGEEEVWCGDIDGGLDG